MPNFKIDIISDTVCPWCYIGHKRLQKGISLFQKTHPAGKTSNFTINYLPYYLDPHAPKTGVPWEERSKAKFGADRVPAIQQRLSTIGASEGIDFSFSSKVGSTRDSHRLIELAKSKGQETQLKLVERLFAEYFEGGSDVTDVQWLQSVGVNSGIEESEVKEWLQGNGGGDVVDHEAEKNRGFTNGVPNYTIQGKYVIEGGQEPQEFVRIFAEIADQSD